MTPIIVVGIVETPYLEELDGWFVPSSVGANVRSGITGAPGAGLTVGTGGEVGTGLIVGTGASVGPPLLALGAKVGGRVSGGWRPSVGVGEGVVAGA